MVCRGSSAYFRWQVRFAACRGWTEEGSVNERAGWALGTVGRGFHVAGAFHDVVLRTVPQDDHHRQLLLARNHRQHVAVGRLAALLAEGVVEQARYQNRDARAKTVEKLRDLEIRPMFRCQLFGATSPIKRELPICVCTNDSMSNPV